MKTKYTDPMFMERLIDSFIEYNALWGETWRDQFEENLVKSFRLINPRTHGEATAALTIGSNLHETCDYLLRGYLEYKKAKPSNDVVSSILSLQYWCVPQTYGFLLYREQLWALCAELFDMGKTTAILTLNKIGQDKFSYVDFSANLLENFGRLPVQDLLRLFEIIRKAVEHAKYYCWNSAMIERVEENLENTETTT